MPEATPKKKGFGARFAIPFRSKPPPTRGGSLDSSLPKKSVADIKRTNKQDVSATRRTKSVPNTTTSVAVVKLTKPVPGKTGSGGRQDRVNSFPVVDVSAAWQRDEQTGEVIDHTDLLHSLVHHGSFESLSGQAYLRHGQESAQPGERVVSLLTPKLWEFVCDYLTPADVANLAFTCKAFRDLVGIEAWSNLNHPDNHRHKVEFLMHMDRHLHGHLFCFPCATYHLRTQHGKESLKPANVLNPLFKCPHSSNPTKAVSRTRLTAGRTLPFTFVQLALRSHRFSPDHGITTDALSRRYKDHAPSTWSHQTRYAIVDGHLLLRVVSQCFATPGLPPAGLRHLLYSRVDFVPYFSVCAHWRDGVLLPSVKCALGHIPLPISGGGVNRVGREVKHRLTRPSSIIILCGDCRPIRRCPRCPSEYLIELKMAEDKSDPVNVFKQALVVTRWSDLGDGAAPWAGEWAACNGDDAAEPYDSFAAIGRRAISGVFEAQFNRDTIPGQRILSMNPDKENKGEAGHNWY